MKLNFVIFSLSNWNINYGCNIKDISLELAKHHNVLYVDVPLKRKERWFKKDSALVNEVIERTKSREYLKRIDGNLWHYISDVVLESVNSLGNNYVFDFVNHLNNKRFAKSLKNAIHEVGFNDYILLNDNDVYNGLYLKEMLAPPVYVYYLRDMLSAFKYWKQQVSRLEPKLIEQADIVVTNSEYLASYAAKYNSKSFYVGQGCDVTHYLKKPKPEDIESIFDGISRPIVGYVGALNSERLDVALIGDIAVAMPEVSFVLVGPEDQTFMSSQLHAIKNIHFLGKKEIQDLPKYIHGFDVAFNPQKLNEITIGNYPRKVDEYLAAGVPVVATRTEAMNPFREYVYLAEGVTEYCKSINLAILENSDEKAKQRNDFASKHTWQNNVAEILNALQN